MTLLACLVLLLLCIAVVAGTAHGTRRGRGGPLWRNVARAFGYAGVGAGAVLLFGVLYLCGLGVLLYFTLGSAPRLAGDLGGFVRDSNGAPAPGARIELVYTCSSCGTPHEPSCEEVSDALGAFRFHEPVLHPALLTAFAPGLVSEPVALFTDADASAELDLCLVSEARITGTLLDGDGRPLSEREVAAWPPSGIRQTIETTEHGRFEFRSLPPGRTHLTVAPTAPETAVVAGGAGGWKVESAMTRQIYVDLGAGDVVEVRIPPAPTRLVHVRGRVFENGVEQDRFIDALRVDNEAITDFGVCYEHDFSCLTLGPGLHRFSTWVLIGDQRFPWSIDVEVPNVATFDYDLHILFGDLRGSVRNFAGEPVAGAEVFWLPDDGRTYEGSWPLATAQDDGSFSVRRAPAQRQRLCARIGERLSAWTGVQVSPDQLATVELVIPGE